MQLWYNEFEEVWALPDSGESARWPKITALSPLAEVTGAEEKQLLLYRERDNHDPLLALLVPEHFGVSEVLLAEVDYRV